MPVGNVNKEAIRLDKLETQVEELQTPQLPDTKEDVLWTPHECKKCGTTTQHMSGETDKRCAKCAIDNGDMAIVKEYNVEMDYGKIEDTKDGIESYCLMDCLNTTDPETLAKFRSECAELGCNVCLSDTSFDDIEWPKHYNMGPIEVIDAIESWDLDFRLANVIKYVARAGKKDPATKEKDLRKAEWYLKRFLKKEFDSE